MSLSLARLDLTQIFWDVDDFYREFEQFCERSVPQLPGDGEPKRYQSRLSISEVMTIVIAFHGSGYRTFKDFYKQKVLADWQDAFPNLVSYGRFVELMPWSFMALVSFLNTRCLGEVTGISFIDFLVVELRCVRYPGFSCYYFWPALAAIEGMAPVAAGHAFPGPMEHHVGLRAGLLF